MKAARSVVAILAGYLLLGMSAQLLFVLSGQNPHAPASPQFMLLTTVYGFLVAILAGYVTALLAGRQVLFHGAVLACLIALIALLSLLADLNSGAIWSQLATLLFLAPGATLGAMFRNARVKPSNQ